MFLLGLYMEEFEGVRGVAAQVGGGGVTNRRLVAVAFGGKVHHPRGGSLTIAAQGLLSGRAAVASSLGLPPSMQSQGETRPAGISDCPGAFQRGTILTLDVGWHSGFNGGGLAGCPGIGNG